MIIIYWLLGAYYRIRMRLIINKLARAAMKRRRKVEWIRPPYPKGYLKIYDTEWELPPEYREANDK